jgi:hypothetical protein
MMFNKQKERKKKGHLNGLTRFGPALYRDPETQYSGPFGFFKNKEKLDLGGDLNMRPLSPLNDNFKPLS